MLNFLNLRKVAVSISLGSIIFTSQNSNGFEYDLPKQFPINFYKKLYEQKESQENLDERLNLKDKGIKNYNNLETFLIEWKKRKDSKIEDNIPFFNHLDNTCMNHIYCKEETKEVISNKIGSIMINEYLQMLSERYSFTVTKVNNFINEVRTYVSTEYNIDKNSFSKPNFSNEESIIIGKPKDFGFIKDKNVIMTGLKVYADDKLIHVNGEVKTKIYDTSIKAEYDPINRKLDFGLIKELKNNTNVSFGHSIINDKGFSYIHLGIHFN